MANDMQCGMLAHTPLASTEKPRASMRQLKNQKSKTKKIAEWRRCDSESTRSARLRRMRAVARTCSLMGTSRCVPARSARCGARKSQSIAVARPTTALAIKTARHPARKMNGAWRSGESAAPNEPAAR
jgi:hypothetical protein